MNILTYLLDIRASDPDVLRRGRISIRISLGMIVLAVAFIPLTLITQSSIAIVALTFGMGMFVAAVLVTRNGRVDIGAWLLVGATLLAIVLSMAFGSISPSTPFYLVLPLLMASIILPPQQIWSILVMSLLSIGLMATRLTEAARSELFWQQSLQGAPILLIAISVLCFAGARSLSNALREANAARADAEHAREQVLTANADLENRVIARTTDLERMVAEQRHTAAELKASLAAQQNLNQVINELSVPIIPVTHDTLIVPLVGGIDSTRAEHLMSDVLTKVEQERARMVILDVTGVAVVDTMVASALLRVADAIRLMGANTMICGIRPEVAQTLVQLGADLSSIRTSATLQDSLANVL